MDSEGAFRIVVVVILLLLVGDLVHSGLLVKSSRDGAGPAAFPIIGLLITFAGLAAATISAWRRPRVQEMNDNDEGGAHSPFAALLMAVFSIAYIHAVLNIGLVSGTIVTLPILALASGAREAVSVLAVTVIGTLLIWLLFGVLLDVFLPQPYFF